MAPKLLHRRWDKTTSKNSPSPVQPWFLSVVVHGTVSAVPVFGSESDGFSEERFVLCSCPFEEFCFRFVEIRFWRFCTRGNSGNLCNKASFLAPGRAPSGNHHHAQADSSDFPITHIMYMK